MAFLALVELLFFLFGFYVLVTQIVVPLFRGTALFPFLRRQRQVYDLIDAREEAEVAALEADIQRLIAELRADLAKQTQEAQDVPSTGEHTDDNSK